MGIYNLPINCFVTPSVPSTVDVTLKVCHRQRDAPCGLDLTEVLEHQYRRGDRGQRIGPPRADDVVRRAVDRLEQRGAGARGVQVGARREADAAGDRTGQVREDVAEQVVGHDDAVALGTLDEVDARGVDVVVVDGDVRELRRHLGDDARPEVAGEGEHVGLVDQRQSWRGEGRGPLEGVAHAALHAEARVDRTLGRDLLGRPAPQLAALAGVGALGVLAHDGERTTLRERAGDAAERSVVDVEVETESQPQQQSALQDAPGDPGVADRGPDRTQHDGVVAPQFFQGRVVQDEAVLQVPGGAQVVGRRRE